MKLIILDRDGVINFDSDQFIKNPEEWKPIPGSLEAIARLNQADYRVVVATNQSGIGRGLFDMPMLNAIHDKMHKACALVGARIDAVFFARIPPKAIVIAASPRPACWKRSRNDITSALQGCRRWAIRCATCNPPQRWVRSPIWC